MTQTLFYKRRRCKILFLSQEDVINATMSFLTGCDVGNKGTFLTGEKIKRSLIFKDDFEMPDKVEILACVQDIARDGFRFLLYHESFKEVSEGDVYPEIEYTAKREYILDEEIAISSHQAYTSKPPSTETSSEHTYGTMEELLANFREKEDG